MFIYLQMIEAPEERSKFESIYLLHRNTMYAVAYRILQNAEDAEDAVHYAFLKILENGGNALAECILKLSAQQRNVLILKYHHGYELKDVAKILGITYSNALTIEKRAKKKLKSLCEEAELI